MPTARERMIELSSAEAGSTARNHFLSIQNTIGDLNIYGEIEIDLMPDLIVDLDNYELDIVIDDSDFQVTLEDEFEVEVDC